jgi:flavodoxin
VLSACGGESRRDARADPSQPAQAAGGGRILLAYFSRPGENYWNGGRRNLKDGNTEVLARAISARLDCDVHRIEAAEPYPADYDETVQRNVEEQDTDARPAIANPLASIDAYDTFVLASPIWNAYDTFVLASPIWNVQAPMIMTTFAERDDFADKTVHPITTYAMSGLGATPEDYARDCRGARIEREAVVGGDV